MMHDELLRTLLAPDDHHGRIFGVVVGVVTNNRDPEGMHRVKLRFPWLHQEHESHWARVSAAMAGPGRGAYFLPEVDDEVLVAFEHGSLEHPFVIGALWNGKDAPPENNDNGQNNSRTIRSRSGHVLRLHDEAGSERIEVIDRSENNKLVISTADNKIVLEALGDIEITSHTGTVRISGVKVEVTSTTATTVQAQTNVDVTASAQVNIKGALVNINL
jgi:uncharacterized protein involved in type VI secretion and phage assembly